MLEIVCIFVLKPSLTTEFDNYLAWSIKISKEYYSHEGWLRRLTVTVEKTHTTAASLKEKGNKSIQIR